MGRILLELLPWRMPGSVKAGAGKVMSGMRV